MNFNQKRTAAIPTAIKNVTYKISHMRTTQTAICSNALRKKPGGFTFSDVWPSSVVAVFLGVGVNLIVHFPSFHTAESRAVLDTGELCVALTGFGIVFVVKALLMAALPLVVDDNKGVGTTRFMVGVGRRHPRTTGRIVSRIMRARSVCVHHSTHWIGL